MKKIIPALFLLFFTHKGFSQTPYSHYLDMTCEWRYYQGGWNINSYTDYDTVYFDGTITLNGNVYYQQYRKNLEIITWWSGQVTSQVTLYGPGYVREDAAGKFYYYDSTTNTDVMYFDNQAVLAMQVGDALPQDGPNCTVQTLGTVSLGSMPLKRVYGSLSGSVCGLTEGIGQIGPICSLGFEGNRWISCYTKNGNNLQFGTEDCSLFPIPNRVNVLANTIHETEANSLVVYPNPTKGVFNIRSSSSYESQRYTLTNLYGAIVKQGKLENNQIDIADFATGVYLLKVEGGMQTQYGKIVKE